MKKKDAAIREQFIFLYQHQGDLSLNQIDLVKGLKKYYDKHGTLSERQKAVLNDIRQYCRNLNNEL